MVRLTDLHAAGQQGAKALECPDFSALQAATPASQAKRKLALVSSAGLIRRGDKPFKGGDAGYRVIDKTLANEDILLSHISVNFDRSAATRNIESIMPRELAKQLVADGDIAAVADEHYSFMGATDPKLMEESATEVAQRMLEQGVNTAVLLPV